MPTNAQDWRTTSCSDSWHFVPEVCIRRHWTGKCHHRCPRVDTFASHDSYGVVDLGATKTVIGSDNVSSLIQGLHPEVQKKLQRCKCQVTFRFGNHGTLQSQHALVVPFQGFKLKIAVVPGSTPFLLSNTLLRAIEAVIDTQKQTLWSQKLQRMIPLHITSKGLFLMDLNDLAQPTGLSDSLASEPARDPFVRRIRKTCACVHQCWGERNHDRDNLEKTIEDKGPENNKPQEDSRSLNSFGESKDSKDNSSILTSTSSNLSPAGSKPFAKSFQVLDRVNHGKPCTSIEEGADRGQRATSRFLGNVNSGQLEESKIDFGTKHAGDSYLHVWTHDQTWVMWMVQHYGNSRKPSHMKFLKFVEMKIEESRARRVHCPSDGTCSHKANSLLLWQRGMGSPHWCPRWKQRANHAPWELLKFISTRTATSSRRTHSRCSIHWRPRRMPRSSASRPGCSTSRTPFNKWFATWELSRLPQSNRFWLGLSIDPWSRWCVRRVLSWRKLPETNQERTRFQRLLTQYSKELSDLQKNSEPSSSTYDLFEVFCHPKSTLTHQCQQQGFKAMRFSLEQGDLQSFEGRSHLYRSMLQHNPRSIWFAPTCGPWSGWSNINGSRSIHSWDELHQRRMCHLEQIALGIVLLRFQRENGRHLHWEQPQSSLMFKLPYLSELHHYTRSIDIDMCTAGPASRPCKW